MDKEIKEASFKDATELKNAVYELSIAGKLDMDVLFGLGGTAESLIKNLMALDADERTHKALFKCLENSLLDGKPIREEIFLSPELADEYYPVLYECLEKNMLPFLKSLLHMLSEK